eukprot:1188310-Prorocentrum_minimum.AAC.2
MSSSTARKRVLRRTPRAAEVFCRRENKTYKAKVFCRRENRTYKAEVFCRRENRTYKAEVFCRRENRTYKVPKDLETGLRNVLWRKRDSYKTSFYHLARVV